MKEKIVSQSNSVKSSKTCENKFLKKHIREKEIENIRLCVSVRT